MLRLPLERSRLKAMLALLIATSLSISSASPIVWYTQQLRERYGISPADPGCAAHPTTSVAAAPHGTPIQDSTIEFGFTDPANGNAAVSTLCPGSTYSLTVSFGNTRRLALLSSDPPLTTFTSPTPPVAGCPNQVDLGGSNKANAATSYTTTFIVQCAAAGSSLTFKVTSAGSGLRQWRQNSASIPVASLSAPGTCAAAAAACTAPPSPPSPVPPPPPPVCIPSTLGYDCMTQQGNVTVHWSLNSTAAPDNVCTPATKTVMQPADVTQYGTIHVAVEAAVTGYVALAFTSTPGRMIPADIIMGFVSAAGANGPPALVNTFNVTTFARLNASSNNTDSTWAYDRGVVDNSTTGVTTLCFSRRLADNRATSTPDLRAASATRLGLNWAVSTEDAIVRHQRGSFGGFWLDIPAVPARGGQEETSKDVDGKKEEDEDDEGEKVRDADVSAPPLAVSGGNCTPSTLGYDCMTQKGKVILHWSVNKPSAPAAGGCTPANRLVLQDAELAQNGVLHIAVQSQSTGYVALGFNSNPDVMAPADIILGWAGSSPYLNTFHVTSSYLGEGNINPPAGTPSWAYDSGVVRNATTGLTTVCFSRRLVDSRAPASADLRSALPASLLGGQQSGTAAGRRRLFQSSSQGTAQLGLIWAINPAQALEPHAYEDVGGFYVDLASGAATEATRSKPYWIDVHGALMAVSWGLLLPLGALFPAHRWLLGGEENKVLGKALWFWMHVGCQWSGMALFIAGFVVAFIKVGDPIITKGVEVAEAHETIAIAIMAAAGAQVVFAFARPAPEHPKRPIWNLLHHNLGRATVLLAWANVYTGIYAYHNSQYAASYTEWITPIAIVMGLLVIADVVLRFMAPSKEKAKQMYDGGARTPAPAGDGDGFGVEAHVQPGGRGGAIAFTA